MSNEFRELFLSIAICNRLRFQKNNPVRARAYRLRTQLWYFPKKTLNLTIKKDASHQKTSIDIILYRTTG